jgi:tetratricopeptide (TPR) repeat protein
MPKVPIPFSEDLQHLLVKARSLSLKFKHGFIHYPHVYTAILTSDCEASKLCSHDNAQLWLERLEKLYPNNSTDAADARLPLTLAMEHIIRHASSIAEKTGESKTNSAHALLALLSFDSEVSESFDKAGITFEEVATAYNGKPFKRFAPEIPSMPSAVWLRWLMPRSVKKNLLARANYIAVSCFNYGLYDRCIAVCHTGLHLDAKAGGLRQYMGWAYIRKRAYPEALTVITSLLASSPEDKDLRITLANIYNATGDYAKAEQVLQTLLAQFPDDAVILNNAGINLSYQTRYEEATVLLEKATSIKPDFAYPWNNLGFARCKMGQTADGLALIDKSLNLYKGNSYAYKNKGIVFFEQNQYDEAMKQFQLALKYGYPEKYDNELDEYLTSPLLPPPV